MNKLNMEKINMHSRKKIGSILFKVSYAFFFVFSMTVHIGELTEIVQLFRNFAIFLLLVVILLKIKMYKSKDVILITIFLCMAVLTHDKDIIKFVGVITAAKGEKLEECIKLEMILRVIVMITIFVLCYCGVATDVQFIYDEKIRHSMGFSNPNAFGLVSAILCFEVLYLTDMKLNLFNTGLIFGILFCVDDLARSRTAELVILLAIGLALVNTIYPLIFKNKFIRYTMTRIPYACFGGTMALVTLYMYKNKVAIEADKVLSRRLEFPAAYLTVKPYSLFGMNIGPFQMTVDNIYAYAWIRWGIVGTILFLFLLVRTLKKCIKNRNQALLFVMTCLFIYGLSERIWFNVDYNVFMLICADVSFKKYTAMNVKPLILKSDAGVHMCRSSKKNGTT